MFYVKAFIGKIDFPNLILGERFKDFEIKVMIFILF